MYSAALTSPVFTCEGKSLSAHELRSGDLEVTGYAVVYEGLDASAERFLKGSLDSAIPRALAAGLPIAYAHGDRILGRVLELTPDSRGVHMRARVDKQSPGSPLFHLYEQVKRGTLKGLSIAGYWLKTKTAAGVAISNVLRLTEVSICAVPQHPETGLDSIEVKALGLDAERERLEGLFAAECGRRLDLAHVQLEVAGMRLDARR